MAEAVFKSPELPPPLPISKESTEDSTPSTSTNETQEKETPKLDVRMSVTAPALDYSPPPWACEPKEDLAYKLEVIRNGSIIDCYDISSRKNGSYVVIGRLPTCDVVLEHPSISRYHCVLQYGQDIMDRSGKGWYVYDLGSTHGTKANKKTVPAKQYIRVFVGHTLQFGGSTRLFNILGPESDSQREWDCSPTEMRERIAKKKLEQNLAALAKKEFEEDKKKEAENEGIDWGMDYEADDRNYVHLDLDAHLLEDSDAFYRDDPKKALTKFFEREGFEMVFNFSEGGPNFSRNWTCTIEFDFLLPVDTAPGQSLRASATVSSSKKDAQTQCALEACRILDAHGILRTSRAKLRRQNNALKSNDYYEEEDDEYLDRTGQIEKQRLKRKQWEEGSGESENSGKDTFESLQRKLNEALNEKRDVQARLDKLHSQATAGVKKMEGDSLDEYCNALVRSGSAGDDAKIKLEKSNLRQRLVVLTHDIQRLEKLVKIARPVALPEVKTTTASSSEAKANFLKKLGQLGRGKIAPVVAAKVDRTPALPPSIKDSFKDSESEESEEKERKRDSDLVTATAAAEKTLLVVETRKETGTETASIVNTTKAIEETPHASTAEEASTSRAEAVPLPTGVKRTAEEDATEKDEQSHTRRKRVRVRHDRKVIMSAGDYGEGCATKDEDYATWLPPDNQSGDGSTALNAKFAGRY